MTSKRVALVLLPAVLFPFVSPAARADSGDKIVRATIGSVTPTADLEWGGVGQTDFRDPRFPPLGRLDSREDHRTDADDGLGLGLGFEYMLSELIGIDTTINYSHHDIETVFGGEVTYIPLLGDPPALDSSRAEAAAIRGSGAGEADLLTLAVGVHLHVLRKERLDLYVGPVVGAARLDTALTSGGFRASFHSFESATPGRDVAQGTEASAVFGAVLGVDVALGREGRVFSASTRYLAESVAPWSLQLGFGYRFRGAR